MCRIWRKYLLSMQEKECQQFSRRLPANLAEYSQDIPTELLTAITLLARTRPKLV